MAVLDHTATITIPPDDPGPADRPNPPRIFRLAGMGPLVRAHFVRILIERAWARLDQQAQYVNGARFNRLEAALMRDITAGKYEWGDDIHNSIEGTKAGETALLLARLRATFPDHTEEDVETLVNKLGWQRLYAYTAQADGPALPNGLTPEPAGAKSMTKESSGLSAETSPEPTRPS